MLILFLWLADVVTKFSEIVGVMCFVAFMVSISGYVIMSFSIFDYARYGDLEAAKGVEVLIKKTKVICFISAFVGTVILLIPSKGTLYTIAGVYTGQQIIESEKVNSLLDKSYILIERKLDEVIENDKSE